MKKLRKTSINGKMAILPKVINRFYKNSNDLICQNREPVSQIHMECRWSWIGKTILKKQTQSVHTS